MLDAPTATVLAAALALLGALGGAALALLGVMWRSRHDAQMAEKLTATNVAIENFKAVQTSETTKITSQTNLKVAELTAAMNKGIAELKVGQDLQVEYDKSLRDHRIASYKPLWASLVKLARYPEPVPLPHADVRPFSEALRKWYFEDGGLFMSEETRDKYFDLQDGLRIVLLKRAGSWPTRLSQPLAEHLGRGKHYQVPDAVRQLAEGAAGASEPNVSDDVLLLLIALGSALRTSMAEDVLTRRASLLRGAEEREKPAVSKPPPAAAPAALADSPTRQPPDIADAAREGSPEPGGTAG
jgi:hypothetical protein